jgi:hypothetical protein
MIRQWIENEDRVTSRHEFAFPSNMNVIPK